MRKNRDIPERGADDKPATDEQIEYLRRLSDLGDEELSKLGKWQASELIERLRKEQRAREEALFAPGRRAGCIKGLTILVLLGAIGGMVWLVIERREGAGSGSPAPHRERSEPVAKPAPAPEERSAARGTGGAETPGRSVPASRAEVPAGPAWPPKELPAVFRTTHPVELLAGDGSAVTIGEGQLLRVIDSPRPNVWRFQHGARVLVGSGGRVEGKLAPAGGGG